MNYAIISAEEVSLVDFALVEQDSADTLRYSVDGSLALVKWSGEAPGFLADRAVFSHSEILEELQGEDWTPAGQGLRYIKYRAKGSATARSRELYLEQLGRPLEPGESAKLLFPCEVSSKTFGGSVIVFNGNGAEFTPEEAEDFEPVGNDDWIQWQAKYQPVPVT
tara:strand:+ start:1356 stop:1850 length:495 start_codon:yes stop_codon:yes gene_type:complete